MHQIFCCSNICVLPVPVFPPHMPNTTSLRALPVTCAALLSSEKEAKPERTHPFCPLFFARSNSILYQSPFSPFHCTKNKKSNHVADGLEMNQSSQEAGEAETRQAHSFCSKPYICMLCNVKDVIPIMTYRYTCTPRIAIHHTATQLHRPCKIQLKGTNGRRQTSFKIFITQKVLESYRKRHNNRLYYFITNLSEHKKLGFFLCWMHRAE